MPYCLNSCLSHPTTPYKMFGANCWLNGNDLFDRVMGDQQGRLHVCSPAIIVAVQNLFSWLSKNQHPLPPIYYPLKLANIGP